MGKWKRAFLAAEADIRAAMQSSRQKMLYGFDAQGGAFIEGKEQGYETALDLMYEHKPRKETT